MLTLPVSIAGSVGITERGKVCRNLQPDREKVVQLLNMIPADRGGTAGMLKLGASPQELRNAIINFQAHPSNQLFRLSRDGHVDPRERTLDALNKLAALSAETTSESGPIGPSTPENEFRSPTFRIKMVGSVGLGVIPLGAMAFWVWDTRNGRAAMYNYFVISPGVGSPTVTGDDAPWSDEFHATNAIGVDQLNGGATHITTGVASVGSFALNIDMLKTRQDGVFVPTGFTFGFTVVEAGGGPFILDASTVQDFNGPLSAQPRLGPNALPPADPEFGSPL